MKRKFVSRWVKANPLEVVAERIRPAKKQGDWVLDRSLKVSSAFEALMRGEAARTHIEDIIAAHNMAVALQKFKIGEEHRDVTLASSGALVSITERFNRCGRYGVTGREVKALQELVELHNAQLESACVGEVQKAYEYAVSVERSSGDKIFVSGLTGESG